MEGTGEIGVGPEERGGVGVIGVGSGDGGRGVVEVSGSELGF